MPVQPLTLTCCCFNRYGDNLACPIHGKDSKVCSRAEILEVLKECRFNSTDDWSTMALKLNNVAIKLNDVLLSNHPMANTPKPGKP